MKDREAVTTNGRAAFYASMWPDFRQAALDHGWALGLHGSLANDMDIMAMPWTENPSSVWDMIMSLRKCFGRARDIDVTETEMPNHRKVFTLSIWSDFYLDINIIDPKAENLALSGVVLLSSLDTGERFAMADEEDIIGDDYYEVIAKGATSILCKKPSGNNDRYFPQTKVKRI